MWDQLKMRIGFHIRQSDREGGKAEDDHDTSESASNVANDLPLVIPAFWNPIYQLDLMTARFYLPDMVAEGCCKRQHLWTRLIHLHLQFKRPTANNKNHLLTLNF